MVIQKNNGWKAEDQYANAYLSACISAVENDQIFAKFKSIQGYKNILEHVTQNQGQWYLDISLGMAEESLYENLETFKENDKIGNPDKFTYSEVGEISPTTLRYIKNVYEMANFLQESSVSRIVEVGGGYGGLCKTLSVVCDFDEYILIDLPEVIAVQEKYLKNFPELYAKCKFVDCNNIESIENIDLFISNYALSECDYNVQINYYEKLIVNSKFVYLIYNFVNFYEFYFDMFMQKIKETHGNISTRKDFENTVILAKPQ